MPNELIKFISMHWELCLAFILIFIYWIISEILEFRSSRGISPAQLVHLMNREKAQIIDIRDTAVFETGHIINALSYPEKTLFDKLAGLKKYQSYPVILVDKQGISANKCINKFIAAGFEKAHYLKNGMAAWQQAKLPLERTGKSEKMKQEKK